MWGATSKPKETSPCPFHTEGRLLSKCSGREKPDTRYLMESTGAKQEHHVAAGRGSYRTSHGNREKECSQAKIPPHGQELCRERGPLRGRGSWGNALQPSLHPAGKLCLQSWKAGGTASKDPKAEIFGHPGNSVHLSLTSSPFLPFLSHPTITASLSLRLLEILSPLYCPPPFYSFFHLLF